MHRVTRSWPFGHLRPTGSPRRFRATALAAWRIPLTMAALQIVRGTTPLPADVEEQFRRAYGREMNELEREFYGLESQSATEGNSQYLPKAA